MLRQKNFLSTYFLINLTGNTNPIKFGENLFEQSNVLFKHCYANTFMGYKAQQIMLHQYYF